MRRERTSDDDRFQNSDDRPAGGDGLDRQRAEVDGLLQSADEVFDSINNLHAQQYLQQNVQTGGQ